MIVGLTRGEKEEKRGQRQKKVARDGKINIKNEENHLYCETSSKLFGLKLRKHKEALLPNGYWTFRYLFLTTKILKLLLYILFLFFVFVQFGNLSIDIHPSLLATFAVIVNFAVAISCSQIG